MVLLLLFLAGLLASELHRLPTQNGSVTLGRTGDNVSASPEKASCAAPRRATVYEALNELLTCLVETHIDNSEIFEKARRLNFGRIAGSGVTQGPLLTGLFSTAALISELKSHRLFYGIAPLFPSELGRNESRVSEAAAKMEAYLSHLEESPYVVDTYETLLSNDALPDTIHSLRDFVRVEMFDQWFKPYARQAKNHRQGLMDSSGFGHVFVGEYSSRGVTGFHNWLAILAAEERGEFEYKGFVKVVTQPLMLASIQFDWLGRQKSMSSFAFGVETEFQLALFTACYVVKPGRKMRLRIKGQPVAVQTFNVNHQLESVGSAYFVF